MMLAAIFAFVCSVMGGLFFSPFFLSCRVFRNIGHLMLVFPSLVLVSLALTTVWETLDPPMRVR